MPDETGLGILAPDASAPPAVDYGLGLLAPETSPGQLQQRGMYEAQQRMQAGDTGAGAGEYLARRAIPVTSQILNALTAHDRAAAEGRVRAGTANQEDYDTLAHEEDYQRRSEQATQTIGGQIADIGVRAPALAGEAWLAGQIAGPVVAAASRIPGLGFLAAPVAEAAAPLLSRAGIGSALGYAARRAPGYAVEQAISTPLMPSLYTERVISDNRAAGREPFDPRGLPRALGEAYINNLVLGSVGNAHAGITAEGIAGLAARQGVREVSGVGAFAVAEVVGGLAGTNTHYGLIGDMLNNRWGDALDRVIQQTAAIQAFGFLHEITSGPPARRVTPEVQRGLPAPEARAQGLPGPEPEPGARPGPEPGPQPGRGGAGATPEPTGPQRNFRTAQEALRYGLDRMQEAGFSRDEAASVLRAALHEIQNAPPDGTSRSFAEKFSQRVHEILRTRRPGTRTPAPEPPPEPSAAEPPPERPQAPPASAPVQEPAEPPPPVRVPEPSPVQPVPETQQPGFMRPRPPEPGAPVQEPQRPGFMRPGPPAPGAPVQEMPRPGFMRPAPPAPGAPVQGAQQPGFMRTPIGLRPATAEGRATFLERMRDKHGAVAAPGEGLTFEQAMRDEYLLRDLNPNERRVLIARESDPNLSLEDIGREMGYTRERIRQIEKAALGKLHESMSVAKQTGTEAFRRLEMHIERGKLNDALEEGQKNPRQAEATLQELADREERKLDAIVEAAKEGKLTEKQVMELLRIEDTLNGDLRDVARARKRTRQAREQVEGNVGEGPQGQGVGQGAGPAAERKPGERASLRRPEPDQGAGPAAPAEGTGGGRSPGVGDQGPAAGGGQAAGNQLTAIQKAQLASTKDPFARENLRLRFLGNTTLYDHIRQQGGIDPRSFRDPAEVEHWRGTFGNQVFKDASGKKRGTVPIDRMMDTLWNQGRRQTTEETLLRPPDPNVDPQDHLFKLLASHFIMDGEREAQHQTDQVAHLMEQYHAEVAAEHPDWSEEAVIRHVAEVVAREQEAGGRESSGQPPAEVISEADEGTPEQRAAGSIPGAADIPGADVVPFRHAQPVPAAGPAAPGLEQRQPSSRRIVRRGAIDLSVFRDAWPGIKDWWNGFYDAMEKFGGVSVPKATRLSERVGQSLMEWGASATYAREAGSIWSRKILGDGFNEVRDATAGAALLEMRFRYAKENLRKLANQSLADAQAARQAGDHAKARELTAKAASYDNKAQKITTVFGMAGSPITSDAQYQKIVNSRVFGEIMTKYVEFGRALDELYVKANGKQPDSVTQIPGLPFNAKALDHGDLTSAGTVFKSKRGNLRNIKQKRDPFAEEAGLDAEAYEMRLSAMIENSLNRRVSIANRAEANRVIVAEGLGQWGTGKDVPELRGVKGREVPFVRPPIGTQKNAPGENSLFLHPDLYPEYLEILDIKDPWKIPIWSEFVAPALTRLSLASTTEFMYHGVNNFSAMMQPGMSFRDLFNNYVGVMRDTPAIRDSLMELARIGATKMAAEGLESGQLWGGSTLGGLLDKPINPRSDPTHWMGKFLEVYTRAVRLTADQAYTSLVKQKLAPDSQTGRANFINKLTGNYNNLTMSRMVHFLRETGIGPFATAAANFNMRALDRVLLMRTGVQNAKPLADAQLRGRMLLKYLGLLAAAAISNFIATGRWDGHDDLPIGGIYLGMDEEGRLIYWDPARMVGMRRSLNVSGGGALIEGVRHGRTPGETVDRMQHDIVHSMFHPAMGPGVNFGTTALTGRNAIGMRLAEHAEPGESQAWNNLMAAIKTANPPVAIITGAERPREEQHWSDAWRLLGPVGPQYRVPR